MLNRILNVILNGKDKFIKVMFFSPYVTSFIQPLDQGIMSASNDYIEKICLKNFCLHLIVILKKKQHKKNKV